MVVIRTLEWYGRALAADPEMAEARRDFDWLSAYVSGEAYDENGSARSKGTAARPAATPAGARKAGRGNIGVVSQK